MKRSTLCCAALLCGLALAGCPNPDPGPGNGAEPADLEAIAEHIREEEALRVEGWAARDAGRIAAFYAPDASLVLPCLPRMTGSAPIRDRIAAMLRDRNFELRFDADRVDVAASGDLAYALGTYFARGSHPATGRPQTEVGNYLTAYRRQRDGSWKAVGDIAVQGGPPET